MRSGGPHYVSLTECEACATVADNTLSSQLTFFLLCVAVLYFFQLKYAIEELYYFEFVFDGLPVRGFIGQLVRL